MNYIDTEKIITDIKKASLLLTNEGIDAEEQSVFSGATYSIFKDSEYMGFITLESEDDYILLRHFLMVPGKRYGTSNALIFTRLVVKKLKDMGIKRLIMSADKRSLQRCIEFFFKVKPYAEEEINIKYYYVTL